jgi:hypothetical protein
MAVEGRVEVPWRGGEGAVDREALRFTLSNLPKPTGRPMLALNDAD